MSGKNSNNNHDEKKPSSDQQDATIDSSPAGGAGGNMNGLQPGITIDRYKLVELLGEGGFGTVFLADQKKPVSRQVALKIIKLGMDTHQVIARFEAERQALAMMNHPNIAKVFDAGATANGRPYFVMELVKGIPITQYCDRNKLGISGRLALFQKVCSAVQHAHQKGIIHRDIKPSNVLVSDVGGEAAPKVIDFGIAKATNQRLTEKTIFTQQSTFIGTPEYMSPEQAEITELDIDTRSDIYSLGVLLYELLSGATPFDGKKLRSAGYGEIQRIIREDEPPLPSTKAHSLGESLMEIAASRRQRGSQLVKQLKGELDWIIMKCLEKDRTRRYETANGLSRDLERYLVNEPVAASPPSRIYRLRKLMVRNRAAFAAGIAMVLLLSAGIIGTSIGMARAIRAEKEAVSEAAKSDQVATFLTDMLAGVGPSASRGRDTAMLEEIMLETQEKISEELKTQPEVEGIIRSFLGTTYFDLGEFEKAKEQFKNARDLFEAAHGGQHTDLAMQYSNLGMTHGALQEFEASEKLYREALAMRLLLFGDINKDVADNKMNLANMLVSVGRYGEAEPLLREALEVLPETGGKEDGQVATCLNSLGNLMQHLGRLDEAGPFYNQALAMHSETLGVDHPFTITDMANLAWLYYNQGKYKQAETQFGAAAEIARRVYGDRHPNLVENIKGQASCQQKLGNFDEAGALYREAWDMASEIFGADHLSTADVIGDYSTFLGEIGRNDESEELTLRVLVIQKAQLGETHPSTLATLQNFAYALYKRKEYDRAEELFRESAIIFTEAFGRDHKKTSLVINNLGRVLREKGDLPGAKECFEESAAIRGRVLGNEHFLVAVSNHDLAKVIVAEGSLDLAAGMYKDVVTSYIAAFDSTHWVVGSAMSELAAVEIDRDNYRQALEKATQARTITAAAKGEDNKGVVFADVLVAVAQGHLGSRVQAESSLKSLEPRIDNLKPMQKALAQMYVGDYMTSVPSFTEAEASFLVSYEIYASTLGDDHWKSRKASASLKNLYEDWSKAGSAEAGRKLGDWN